MSWLGLADRTPTLAPGASATLKFTAGNDAVAMVDWAGSRKAFAGSYKIEFFTGGKEPDATETFEVQTTVTLSTLPPPRPSR